MHPAPITPGPGQESVWDYPRPPRIEPVTKHLRVVFGGETVADTRRAIKYMETSHPPTYYIPREDIVQKYLVDSGRVTVCEYKGAARYVSLRVGNRSAEDAGWYYPTPSLPYSALADHIAFYPQMMDECFVDGELVTPQPGSFNGGWITSDVVGPFKGASGTLGW
jgi:uncharacterized protein (DUF427 family)